MVIQEQRLCLSELSTGKPRGLLLSSSPVVSPTKSMILGLVLRVGVVCVVEILKMLKSFCERRRKLRRQKEKRSPPPPPPCPPLLTQKSPRILIRGGGRNPQVNAISIIKSRSFNGFPSRKKFVSRRRGSVPSPRLFPLKEENEEIFI
eukprot:TRINITY_DN3276_c0_g1_i1.p1 TRINITY_DN3276_c0_g1~~TRINITY_DN3276_c0_g1_i1.p1  ORF type:complete len:148 (-),score=45.50 TRINITY_DN3276_c0_g1_i1:490-933(-)